MEVKNLKKAEKIRKYNELREKRIEDGTEQRGKSLERKNKFKSENYNKLQSTHMKNSYSDRDNLLKVL